MIEAEHLDACPTCGQVSGLRSKLVLIDEAWVPAPGKDQREAYFADLRVDDVDAGSLRSQPLRQFIDGFYCDRCNKGFIPQGVLKPDRRRYR